MNDILYQGQVTLPGTCSDWYIYVSVSARNDAITNLENPGSYDLLVSVGWII
jgi:hypothetical protein